PAGDDAVEADARFRILEGRYAGGTRRAADRVHAQAQRCDGARGMARGAAGSNGVTLGWWERVSGRHGCLTKANTSSTIEIPASLRSEGRSPSDRNAKDRLWPPSFHTQKIAKPPLAACAWIDHSAGNSIRLSRSRGADPGSSAKHTREIHPRNRIIDS